MSYTREQRETIGALAADALFASNGQTNTHADYGNESEALGAALGAYLAGLDSRPERLADVITALLAPFGEGVAVETLTLLCQSHDDDAGYNIACRLAGLAIADGGPRDMGECVKHYMPAHVAAHVAAELARQGKPADAMRALAAELEAK
jgi:hypothetical protein